jgi:transposase InsO family protein
MNAVYLISGVSKQAVHKWSRRQQHTQLLLEELVIQVDELRAVHPGCGLEKMYDTLKPSWLGRDKFIEVFMELGYRVRKRPNYVRTTISSHIRFPNLIEGLLVHDKNRVWQTDITYFRVNDEHFYITFIIDIYTKVIRAYEVSDHMRAEANIAALQRALRSAGRIDGLIHHSDRGSQYVDHRYRKILSDRGIHISMGSIAQENAYAERINGTIKNEYLYPKHISSLSQLKKELKIAVDHYNNHRIHRHLPTKLSPRKFENQLVDLSTQNRPKVIVYTEGNCKIRAASSRPDFNPETEPQVHVCPMVTNM